MTRGCRRRHDGADERSANLDAFICALASQKWLPRGRNLRLDFLVSRASPLRADAPTPNRPLINTVPTNATPPAKPVPIS